MCSEPNSFQNIRRDISRPNATEYFDGSSTERIPPTDDAVRVVPPRLDIFSSSVLVVQFPPINYGEGVCSIAIISRMATVRGFPDAIAARRRQRANVVWFDIYTYSFFSRSRNMACLLCHFSCHNDSIPTPPSQGIRCNKHNRCCFSFSVEHGVTFVIELWVGDSIKFFFRFTDKDKVGIRVK